MQDYGAASAVDGEEWMQHCLALPVASFVSLPTLFSDIGVAQPLPSLADMALPLFPGTPTGDAASSSDVIITFPQ